MSINVSDLALYRERLKCNFKQVDDVFDDCMEEAVALLSEQGINDYLDGASRVGMIGRGFDPVLTYLEEMPRVAHELGEETLKGLAGGMGYLAQSKRQRHSCLFTNNC